MKLWSRTNTGLGQLLSPEMGSTVVWWLRRFALTYLLPNENLYAELSPCFSAAFGRDSEGANWITGFLLNKVESNLRTQAAEPALMDETLKLFMALVDTREKRNVVINSGPFWTLVRLHNSPELLQLGGAARRKFFQALTIAGAGASSAATGSLAGLGDQNYFWTQVLKPLQERMLAPIQSGNLNRFIHQENVRATMVNTLESLIGKFSMNYIFNRMRLLKTNKVKLSFIRLNSMSFESQSHVQFALLNSI